MRGTPPATTKPEPAGAFIIAVPTPFKDQHAPDLRFIEAACASIAPVIKAGDLVILESTSPVGATEQMAAWLSVAPQASKVSSLLKSGALGLFGGGVLMLLFVMGQNAWLRARKAK
jgi:UDP-N-acetyl-D-mannosaminuronate dehydrogenase